MRRYRLARSVCSSRAASATLPCAWVSAARDEAALVVVQRVGQRPAQRRGRGRRRRAAAQHLAHRRRRPPSGRSGWSAARPGWPARARCPARRSRPAPRAPARVNAGACRGRTRSARWATSAGRSSSRSRSGGRRIGKTLSRKNRSSRKSPSATASSSRRLVAATMRTSTRCERLGAEPLQLARSRACGAAWPAPRRSGRRSRRGTASPGAPARTGRAAARWRR